MYVVATAVLIFIGTLYVLVPQDIAYWTQYWWMFPVAFVIALIVNTAGISGAALFVPFFILIFPLIANVDISPVDSVKLGLITESFGLSSSALAFLSFGLVDLVLAKRALKGAIPFVLVGVLFVFIVPKSVLYILIAILLLTAVFLIQYKHRIKQARKREEVSENIHIRTEHGETGEQVSVVSNGQEYKYYRTKSGAKKRFLGYGIGGMFQGASGFGIGELGIISMILTNIPIRIAIGTSHFIVAGTAIIASIVHLVLSSSFSTEAFMWNIPAMTVPAVILGGQFAPYVAARLSTKYLERFVSLLFVIIAGALVVLAFI